MYKAPPDELGLVPIDNLHGPRRTKSERSSTPPSHQTYSIEHPVGLSSHNNLPISSKVESWTEDVENIAGYVPHF